MNSQPSPQRPRRPSYSESNPNHHPLPLPPPPPPPSYTTTGTGPPTPTKTPSRISSRTLNRRPSNLVVNLASPISTTSTNHIPSPSKAQYGVISPVSASSTGTASSFGGQASVYSASSSGGTTHIPTAAGRLPPGAAPSSFAKYQGLGIGAPKQNSYPSAPQKKGIPNQEGERYGSPPGGYQRSVSEAVVEGNGHANREVMGWVGGRQRSGSQTHVERNGVDQAVFIDPPTIPQLPPSPSLDMAYFSGQPNAQPRSHSQSNNLSAPQPDYFSHGPPQVAPGGSDDRLARLAAASGVDISVSTSSVRNSSDGTGETMDEDSFDRRTNGTAMTSMTSIASSTGDKKEVRNDASSPSIKKQPSTSELLPPPNLPFKQGSRPGSPARSIPPSPLGYDASLLPPRAMGSRSVSSSVVSSASSNASSGSGNMRVDIIASTKDAREGRDGGKRGLPTPPVPKGDDRARQYSQPRSVSVGAMNKQAEQRPGEFGGFSNGPRQPSPLSFGASQDSRRAPTPPRVTTKVSHKDLPPIQTPNTAIFNPIRTQPQQYVPSADGRSSPVERTMDGSLLAARPPRSASLGIKVAVPGVPPLRGLHSPPSSAPPPLNVSAAHSPPEYEATPTSAAVESIIEEMMHPNVQDGEAPHSPRRNSGQQRRPESSMSNRSEMSGGMMDRPRPSKKSSEYTIRPTMGTRSPTPLQGGSQSFRQVSAASSRYAPSYGSIRHGKASLEVIMMEETIQQTLLPFMSIASFLALLGALPAGVRRTISGEIIGRWVCREWGVAVDQTETWPGLQVWEGFLESLLHDPSAFPTYPPHFRPLLQHLSLSHTLIVLFLRSLPADAFPGSPPFAWEDDGTSSAIGFPNSQSAMTLNTMAARSRTGSALEIDSTHAPRQERLFELIMPEPLSAVKPDVDEVEVIVPLPPPDKKKRRGSIGSASLVSWSKGRRNSTSTTASLQNRPSPTFVPPSGGQKVPLPPVSFPRAKRYVFRSHPDESSYSSSRRASLESGRPGSVFSVDDTLSLSGAPPMLQINRSMYRHRRAPSESGSSGVGRSSAGGRHSPSMSSNLRFGSGSGWSGARTTTSSPTASRFFRNDIVVPSEPVEPAFDKPLPIAVGRAPVLRVFVPLSEEVRRWPSAEGARRARAELERAGAWSKLVVGDIIINTALQDPLLPRHLMLYSPTMQPFLVPLEYTHSEQGHLPGYINAFDLPPSYYFPILPLPHIVSIDLSPWADRILPTLRLAFDRRDITTARGDKMVAKRYLHVAGFQLTPDDHRFVCEDWEGMITLEADGTAEGRSEILRRIGRTSDMALCRPVRGPWEIIRDKSLGGSVWLKLIQDISNEGR